MYSLEVSLKDESFSNCNISAKSELGRFPITDYIKTQAILYFCWLQTDPINPLLLKDESFSNVFLLYESFITFFIFFFSECFIEAKGLVKFPKLWFQGLIP
jgi:hypothetical protein